MRLAKLCPESERPRQSSARSSLRRRRIQSACSSLSRAVLGRKGCKRQAKEPEAYRGENGRSRNQGRDRQERLARLKQNLRRPRETSTFLADIRLPEVTR